MSQTTIENPTPTAAPTDSARPGATEAAHAPAPGAPRRPRSRFFLRRRYIVDWPFQSRFVATVVALFLFCAVVLASVLFTPALLELQSEGHDRHVAATTLVHLHRYTWPAIAGCVVVVVLVATWMSHRIAGPLVRVNRNLEALVGNRIPREFTTRRNDYLKKEVALLNELTTTLRVRTHELRDMCDRIDEAGIECQLSRHDGDRIRRHVARLRRIAESLRKALPEDDRG